MLTSTLTAFRDDPLDHSKEANAPDFAGVPERLFVAALPETQWSRLGRVIPSATLSVVVHLLLALGFVLLWRTMVQDLTSREPISVEIVHSIPGEDAKTGPKAEQPKAPEPPKPQAPAAIPAPPPSPEKADTPADPPAAMPSPEETRTQASRAPTLVAPPPEPTRAASQTEKNEKANTAEQKPDQPRPPPPVAAPEAPKILAAAQADSTIVAPSTNPDPPKPDKPVEADPAKPDAAAALAAALPMNPMGLPSTFRAMLSSRGDSDNQQYKGVVYGMLGRGHAREVAQEAEHRGLKGQVIVALTISDAGTIDKIAVVQSSGHPDVDTMALKLVQGAAPFPPPPPGTQRSFTPAISFGGE